jgi:pSer/pThr/pTyr-binding forkhead associated (FHA) protein
MATRVLIQHLTGSKINQIDQIPLDGLTEITIGRDPGSTISFDALRDDAVSRRHAIINVAQNETPSFRITDLGSRNGTLINGDTISGEVELAPGDIIELGKGGPKFSFDVQPRPANMLGRTRQITTGATGSATRVLDTADIEAAAMAAATQATAGSKPSVGRETVMGMLLKERRQTNKAWM